MEKYRPTMTPEVLHSWAKDAQELIDRQSAERRLKLSQIQKIRIGMSDGLYEDPENNDKLFAVNAIAQVLNYLEDIA